MNITEYSKCLKSKFATVIGDWDKLTINQLEQIEQLLNNLMPPVEKKQESKLKPKHKVASFRRTNGMNEAMYKEITELRSQGWTWDKLANKFNYAHGSSMRGSWVLWGSSHKDSAVPSTTPVPTVHFSNS